MNDQQVRQRRQTELSRALMRAIAQYADANTNPRVDDGVVVNARDQKHRGDGEAGVAMTVPFGKA